MELEEALKFAKENNLKSITVNGIHMELGEDKAKIQQMTQQMIDAVFNAPDEYTDEELLFYATPYFDELVAKKKARQESLKQDEATRGKA